tara:strand:- start:178 stop:573 length:396 start_codon:yes stop_codon:yes gene_type:complete
MRYKHQDEVRDSELDLQGIVNNSNYFVYMEHARHKHLSALGVDFKKMHDDGYDLVVSEVHMKFKAPLVSQDKYIVTSDFFLKSEVRVGVVQEIIRKSDDKVVASANYTVTCINNKINKIQIPYFLKDKFGF